VKIIILINNVNCENKKKKKKLVVSNINSQKFNVGFKNLITYVKEKEPDIYLTVHRS
jgi:hypothetical protein